MDHFDADGRWPNDGRVKSHSFSSVDYEKRDGSSLQLGIGEVDVCVIFMWFSGAPY